MNVWDVPLNPHDIRQLYLSRNNKVDSGSGSSVYYSGVNQLSSIFSTLDKYYKEDNIDLDLSTTPFLSLYERFSQLNRGVDKGIEGDIPSSRHGDMAPKSSRNAGMASSVLKGQQMLQEAHNARLRNHFEGKDSTGGSFLSSPPASASGGNCLMMAERLDLFAEVASYPGAAAG